MRIVDDKMKAGIRHQLNHSISLYIYFYTDGDMNFNDKRYGDVPSVIYTNTKKVFKNIKRNQKKF